MTSERLAEADADRTGIALDGKTCAEEGECMCVVVLIREVLAVDRRFPSPGRRPRYTRIQQHPGIVARGFFVGHAKEYLVLVHTVYSCIDTIVAADENLVVKRKRCAVFRRARQAVS